MYDIQRFGLYVRRLYRLRGTINDGSVFLYYLLTALKINFDVKINRDFELSGF